MGGIHASLAACAFRDHFFPFHAIRAADLPDSEVLVRPYANGSGPSAIFRLGRIASKQEDVFGIIDPIRWRIQYYTLKDMSTAASSATFRERWTAVGSCRLSPSFRVWRVHEFPDRVVLQSQPFVPRSAFIFLPRAKPAELSFTKVTLDATSDALGKIEARAPTDDREVPSIECGAGAMADSEQPFNMADAETSISGGQTKAFLVDRASSAVTRPFEAKRISLLYKGRFLSAAQELEAATSVNSGDPLRQFLLTTRVSVPGFVSTETVLVRRSQSEKLDRVMVINLGLGRVKLGQRPVAVSSVGEVLVLAASDKTGFRVHQCTFWASATSWCNVEGNIADSPVALAPTGQSDDGSSAKLLNWNTAFDYTDRDFSVDVSGLPKACVELVGTCLVDGVEWAPLPEFRGGTQAVVKRRGFPYGQISGRSALLADVLSADLGMSRSSLSTRLAASVGGKPVVFGDIDNGDMVDPHVATVFGIDCSALLSVMWHLDQKLDTANFIDIANKANGPFDRIDELTNTSIGDAFVINIAATVPGKDPLRYINHIALYRETLNAGPTDSSNAMLVVESNASCGGAC